MTFGEAIETMKDGQSVSRSGWGGTKMWLRLMWNPHDSSDINRPYISIFTENVESLHIVKEVPPYVDSIRDVPPDIVPWVATHADMLADDWFEIR